MVFFLAPAFVAAVGRAMFGAAFPQGVLIKDLALLGRELGVELLDGAFAGADAFFVLGASRLHELQSLQRVHALEIGALGPVFLSAFGGRSRRLHGLGKLAPSAFLRGGDFQLGFEFIQPLGVALARLAFAFFRLAGGARSGGRFAAGGHLGVGGSAQNGSGGGDQKNAFGKVAHDRGLSFRSHRDIPA